MKPSILCPLCRIWILGVERVCGWEISVLCRSFGAQLQIQVTSPVWKGREWPQTPADEIHDRLKTLLEIRGHECEEYHEVVPLLDLVVVGMPVRKRSPRGFPFFLPVCYHLPMGSWLTRAAEEAKKSSWVYPCNDAGSDIESRSGLAGALRGNRCRYAMSMARQDQTRTRRGGDELGIGGFKSALGEVLRQAQGAWLGGTMGLLLRLALVFAKTGLFTFGSGYAMLHLMQREIVDHHGWLTAEQFADLVAIAEVTPGPITVNMATFVGYRLGGIPGAACATLGLIAGPMLAILIIVRFYGEIRHNRYVSAAFQGLRPTVLALITVAVIRLSKTALVDAKSLFIFAGILALLHFFRLSPILAALIGVVAGLLLY